MGRQKELFSASAEIEGFQSRIFQNEEAETRFLEIFKFSHSMLVSALMKADNERSSRNGYHPSRNMTRWSDMVGSAATQVCKDQGYVYGLNNGQPCIENDKTRIIFMTANEDIGNPIGVISSRYPKGCQTEEFILMNSPLSVDNGVIKTWICYFPSAGMRDFSNEDDDANTLEVSYPLSFIKAPHGDKKIRPSHHEERLILNIGDTKLKHIPDLESSQHDDEELEMGLKEA